MEVRAHKLAVVTCWYHTEFTLVIMRQLDDMLLFRAQQLLVRSLV